jgi:hypothetical protein
MLLAIFDVCPCQYREQSFGLLSLGVGHRRTAGLSQDERHPLLREKMLYSAGSLQKQAVCRGAHH